MLVQARSIHCDLNERCSDCQMMVPGRDAGVAMFAQATPMLCSSCLAALQQREEFGGGCCG